MVKVKGPNGLVVDLPASVASGLIDGGHVKAVDGGQDVTPDSEQDENPKEPGGKSGAPATVDNEAAEQVEKAAEAAEAADNDLVAENTVADTADDADPARPGGNASRADWAEYAVSQGFAEEQVADLKRDEIRDLIDEK